MVVVGRSALLGMSATRGAASSPAPLAWRRVRRSASTPTGILGTAAPVGGAAPRASPASTETAMMAAAKGGCAATAPASTSGPLSNIAVPASSLAPGMSSALLGAAASSASVGPPNAAADARTPTPIRTIVVIAASSVGRETSAFEGAASSIVGNSESVTIAASTPSSIGRIAATAGRHARRANAAAAVSASWTAQQVRPPAEMPAKRPRSIPKTAVAAARAVGTPRSAWKAPVSPSAPGGRSNAMASA